MAKYKPFSTQVYIPKPITSSAKKIISRAKAELHRDKSNNFKKTKKDVMNQDSLYDDVIGEYLLFCNSFKGSKNIFEASPQRIELLKNIDKINGQFQDKKITNREYIKMLKIYIREFTGVRSINVRIQPHWLNASVIVSYNQQYIRELKKSNKEVHDLFKKVQHSNSDLKNYETYKKISKIFSSISIYLGDELFDKLSNKEMTAVLLHEIGHVYLYSLNFKIYFVKLLSYLFATSTFITEILSFILAPIYFSIIIPSILISMRSLTFLEHKNEYNADNFVIKFGYGDDMISALNKIKKISKVNIFKKFLLNLIKILTLSAHPTNRDRVCKIVQKMKKDYVDEYTVLRNDILALTNSIKC